MTRDLKASIQDVFRRALQNHLQQALRTGEDWDRFQSLRRATDAKILAEQTAYKRDFPKRMAEAKQLILREETGIRLDQPLPPGAERHSSADALDRKAGTRVRQDHDRRISAIKQEELTAFRDLAAEIRVRDAPAPVRDVFQDRSQDRSGPSR